MTFDSEDKIKGLGPKRVAAGLRVLHDIVIPAGTILRSVTADAPFVADVGFAVGLVGQFSISPLPGDPNTAAHFERVSS